MLPTFLGIGAPKCGTTWLYRLLEGHPDVLLARNRKEVHFFDDNFERGAEWYERFFRAGSTCPAATARGEFTTHYLYDPDVPARARTFPSIDRLLLIVRDPVDRAFSHYRFRRRQDNLTLSFEEFLIEEPRAVTLGCYGRHLIPWLEAFDRHQLLVLVYEQAIADPEGTKAQLAAHLGVDLRRFPEGNPGPTNEAFVPRHGGLYASAVRTARALRGSRLDGVISLAKSSGSVGLLKRPRAAEAETVPRRLRDRLTEQFESDLSLLETLTGIETGAWRAEEA